jgi:hypothetical protein
MEEQPMINQLIFNLEDLLEIRREVATNPRMMLVHQYMMAWSQDQERRNVPDPASMFRMCLGFMKDVERVYRLVEDCQEIKNDSQK